jgi:hypothetical protein
MSQRIVRMYGELVDRTGQPAAGVGLSVVRKRDKSPLGSTVSDSNGAFALAFGAPAAGWAAAVNGDDATAGYELYLSVNKSPVGLPNLEQLTGELWGPHRIVVEATMPRGQGALGVAPRLVLMGDEQELVSAFKKAGHLFSRPVAARVPDPCSPYATPEVPARVFYLQQLAMFPGPPVPEVPVPDIRDGGAGAEVSVGWRFLQPVRYGVILEFRQEWWDMGYALGDLLYSVPLAPCEQTKIATVDWRRRDYARKRTALDEKHFQDTTIERNEIINEAVRLAADKRITGTTEGGGFALSLGPLSGGYSKAVETVEESVDSSADASRYVNDRIQQTSNTLRNTRSFSIAETTQQEESVVRTRTLRNHNHCHTLTFQYFEVLRHYLLSTGLNAVRPAVFVPFVPVRFTAEAVVRNGYLIRRALLDPTLEPVLDRLLGVAKAEELSPTAEPEMLPGADASGGDEVKTFKVTAVASGPGKGKWPGDVDLIVNEALLHIAIMNTGVLEATLPAAMKLSDITKIGFDFSPAAAAGEVVLDDVVVKAVVGTGAQEVLFEPSITLHPGRRFVEKITPPKGTTGAAPARVGAASAADLARLVDHVNANPVYYTAALISGGDPGVRWLGLSRLQDWKGRALADVAESQVAGFVGVYSAFALTGNELPPQFMPGGPGGAGEGPWPKDPGKKRQERVITLPTPGVFAESQLGACSSAEKIDDTRFWDWQTSPCPDEAPDITAEMLASRAQSLRDLLDVVKSDLKPEQVQIPPRAEPMLKIGDETMKELIKGLSLTGSKDVLEFVKGLAQISLDGTKALIEAAKKSPGGPGGGAGPAAGLNGAGASPGTGTPGTGTPGTTPPGTGGGLPPTTTVA